VIKLKKVYLWVLCLTLLQTLAACGGAEGRIPVSFYSNQNHSLKHKFSAELAVTPAQREQGLMYRKSLGADRGMLFIFPKLTQTAFWMQNTLIPLDMVFISPDKKVVSIVENAEPQTTTPRRAEGPFQYVFEIEGGRSKQLGLQAGDQVEFSQ